MSLKKPEANAEAKSAEKSAGMKIKVGDRVLITTINKPGTIRFIGTTKFKPGKWIGMELDDDTGKNDGSVEDVKYFICKPNHGLFVKPSMIAPLPKGTPAVSVPAPAAAFDAASSDTQARREALLKRKADLAAKRSGLAAPTVKTSTAAAAPAAAPAAAEKKTKTSAEKTKTSAALKTPTKTPTKPAAAAAAATSPAPSGSADVAFLQKKLADANATIDELHAELARKPAAGGSGSTALFEAQAATEKKLLAELETANKELEKLRTENKKQKATLADFDELKKKAGELGKCQRTLEMMKGEKEVADETIEELTLELENATREAETLSTELESLKASKAADVETMIGTLPSDQAQIARILEQNKQLTDALRKLRDQTLAAQQKYDNLKEDTDQELEELRKKAIKVDKLENELETAKEALAELRVALDEHSASEEMVESLSDKNIALLEQTKILERQIYDLKKLNEAADEMEEEHLELETQLQAEVEAKELELRESRRALKDKQSLVDDLNATNRQFRALVKELETENQDLMAAKNTSAEEGDRARRNRQQNLKMQARLNQLRSNSLTHITTQLQAQEAEKQLSFIKDHIPDNVSIEMGVVQLLLVVDRLKFKALSAAKLLHEFYGMSTREDSLATYAYTVCAKLMEFSSSCNQLSWCIRVADLNTFNNMVGERDSLDAADNTLDDLLRTVARDEFNDGTSLDDLDVSHENVVGFIAAHFPDEGGEDSRPYMALVRRGPPIVHIEAQKLLFNHGATLSKLQAIGDLLAVVPRKKDANGNAIDDEKTKEFTDIYESMETLQNSVIDLANKCEHHAHSYQLMVHNVASHNPKFVEEEFKSCSKYAMGSQMRLKDLLEWMQTTIQNRSLEEDESKRRDALIESIVGRFKVEQGEKRLMEELASSVTTMKELLAKLDKGEAISQEVLAAPAYETRAQQVREELMHAASVRHALDEATRRAEDKTRELFAAKRLLREAQSKIDVMSAKVGLLQTKTDNTEDMQARVDMLEKRDKEYTATIDGLNSDNEKYIKLAKQYKNKAIKFKFQLKQLRETRAAGGGNTGGSGVVTVTGKDLTNLQVACDEINLLNRTIALLRHQVAEAKTRNQKEDLAKRLQPLTPVKPLRVFSAAHHSNDENIAESCRHQASMTPFCGKPSEADISTVSTLQADLFALSKRVHEFRAAPVLVDVSTKTDTTHGQAYLSRQLAAQKFSSDSASLSERMGTFLSSKQSQAFRSLLATVPATSDAVVGGVSSSNTAAQLFGRLTLPIASSAVPSNPKVTLRPHQFAQLHSVFVK